MAQHAQQSLIPDTEPAPTVELNYTLAALPSSQHRAGLAGLILLIKWMHDTCADLMGGTLTCEHDAQSARITLDQSGLRALFQTFYAAYNARVQSQSKWSGAEPLEIIEREVVDPKTQKTKKQKYFVYETCRPKAAFMASIDPTYQEGEDEGIWLKLWRDMLWQTIRGIPAQRIPYNERLDHQVYTKDSDDLWQAITSKKPKTLSLASTYFLGAQAVTSEQVPFEDHARNLLLLHFWPITTQIYVPIFIDREGKSDYGQGYVFAIPDIALLDRFCRNYATLMLGRLQEKRAYLPAQAIVDLPIESALSYLTQVQEYLAREAGSASALLAVDVVYIKKDGNNVNVKGQGRVEPRPRLLEDYARIKRTYRHSLFRRQRIQNLINHSSHWSDGFSRHLRTQPVEEVIFNSYFQHDIKEAFRMDVHNEISWSETIEHENKTAEIDMDKLIYQLVSQYLQEKVSAQLGSKPGAERKVSHLTQPHRDWNDAQAKTARKAFLAVRSRTGADFVNYLTGTLCSVPQKLGQDKYIALSRVLRDEAKREQLQNMTLLALSALGAPYYFSSRSDSEDQDDQDA